MKKILLLFILPLSIYAHLNIAVSYPFIGALTKEIGGEHVDTIVLAKGNWDPHFVVPRPSLIAKLRSADALIMNGAQLEIGWLPPLIRRAGNSKVQPASPTFLNLSHTVTLINKPADVDRSQGDVHPDGNPHFHLDPYIILELAHHITGFLSRIDAEHSDIYTTNLATFEKQWNQHLERWKVQMASKKGMKVVQFHDNLAYFNKAYGLKNIGTIEPLPGIPPSPKHTLKLIDLMKREQPSCILHDVYHSTKTAEYISDKTGVEIILMPHDIGALDSIETLSGLFDHLVTAVSHD